MRFIQGQKVMRFMLAWEKIICYTEGQGNAKKLLLYL